MSSSAQYRIKGRFWIEGPHGTFLGYGRIRLLEEIRAHGSISAAARSMKMSYRRAWRLVEAINLQSSSLIVETSTGGKGGGGAVLTEKGEQVVAVFWSAHHDFEAYIARRNQTLVF
jgi:molybdate transport system regulatory protein